MKLTPLEIAAGIVINEPTDIINNWEGTSKLIYCYKNDKNLIEWASLLSDQLIEECLNKEFLDLTKPYDEDFLQIGLYLNLMKKNKWHHAVKQKEIVRTINIILLSTITAESINRGVRKAHPQTSHFITLIQNGSNKYLSEVSL